MKARFMSWMMSGAIVLGTMPAPLNAQAPASMASNAAPAAAPAPERFNTEQLDSLLAPIALYPDVLVTQLLMATTNPLEIVAAARWLAKDNHKDLKGAALEAALKTETWDPSVKSLIPFPQVLTTLNDNLEWTQQLGYAMQVQEAEVFDAIQRLRAQAQKAGSLKTTSEQVVRTAPPAAPPPGVIVEPGGPSQVIVIEPARPDVVYVPAYNPSVVYGAWPYPATPPVYYPPSPMYGYGSALATGLAFGAGVAITAGLWNLARPNWGCCWGGSGWRGGYNNVNVNVNRWNNVSVNRTWNGNANGAWRPNNPTYRAGGTLNRPSGPVGRPAAPGGLPAGAIGRPGVSAPGGAVRPPSGLGPGNKPPIGSGGNRPGGGTGQIGQGPGGARPGGGQLGGGPATGGSSGLARPAQRPAGGATAGNLAGNRPNGGAAANLGANRPGGGQAGMTRPGGGTAQAGAARTAPAFSGMSNNRGAVAQQANRGAQSRQFSAPARQAGGGGAAAARGGGGVGRAGGGGGRGGRGR